MNRIRYALLAVLTIVVVVIAAVQLIPGWSFSELLGTELRMPMADGLADGRLWLPLALVIVSLSALVALTTNFYLYRWRRFLSAEPHLLMPEEHGRYLKQLEQRVDRMHHDLSAYMPMLHQRIESVLDRSSQLQSAFLTLQNSLDAKDQEIDRLRKGYDVHVFRSFVNRFVRVDMALADFLQTEAQPSEGLAQSRILLEDALEECGITSFTPELGCLYAEAEGVADTPQLVPVSDPSQDGRVLSIIEHGYRINTPTGVEIIQRAKVRVATYSGDIVGDANGSNSRD